MSGIPIRDQPSTKVALENLAPEHYEILQQAISKILSTNQAIEIFSQVVDGLPTRDVYQQYYGSFRADFNDNLNPSQIALEAVESYRQNFSIRDFQIDTQVAQSYQNTVRGSREFEVRLIEILAVLFHNIAVVLYIKYDGGIHKPDPAYVSQIPSHLLPSRIVLPPRKPKAAHFFHPAYQAWEQYPHGVADIVGYWAEYRMFGGVILFDRGETGSECKNVFIHPIGRYMIFQLSDTQVQRYINLLLSHQSGDQRPASPPENMSFKAEKWAHRIDPYDAMSLNIYRNKYERKIPQTRPVRCVVRGEDMPGYAEAMQDFSRRNGDL